MNMDNTIWLDALDFDNYGGWKEDTQYVHLMGSGFLIAADEPGVPVEDATIKFNVNNSGKYRIWVRDRNWYRQYSPGKFTVLVDGKATDNVLGKIPSDKWLWEIAGDVDLVEGEHVLSAHDLTGYFARFSSILLTTDMDYVPSREVERIYADRAKVKGVDSAVKNGGNYDLIVVGGGPGGCPAAIAAARKGIKVLLIQDRSVLGGNGSSEVGITFDGAMTAHINARESGIAEEIRRLRDNDSEDFGDWERAITTLVNNEPNITVIYNTHVYATDMESDSVIKGVYAMNVRTLEKSYYTAKLFMDCTGDGWLGYHAGAKYRFGREANWQHNEGIAPEFADTMTMSGCIKSGNRPYFFKTEEPVEYHAPEWVPALAKTDEEFGRAITGNGAQLMWWLEAPNVYDDMWDGEETRDALLMVVLGYYDHIKNYWSKKERVQNYRMRFVSVYNGRRESRRLIGDYIMTQDDATSGRRFEDAISYSGWAVDLHHPEGIYSGKKGPLYAAIRVPMPTIPYRCLYSVNIENLFFAGRNVSVTHVALGTVRVQNTITTMGQAAGTAAAMCIRLNETPRGIYKRHIKELQQQLLKDDMFIPGLVNEDEKDPCLTATATASSVSKTEIFADKHGTICDPKPLTETYLGRAGFNTLHGDIKKVWVWLSSANTEPTTINVSARIKGDIDTFCADSEPIKATAIVPPMHKGWLKIDIHVPVEPNEKHPGAKLEVWIDKVDGIAWRFVTNLSFYNSFGVMLEDGTWRMKSGANFSVTVSEPKEELADCSPSNVINGISRIRSPEVYEWVSDPDLTFPQWIELSFKEKAIINSVSVVFDTDMTNPGTSWGIKIPHVPLCVKDYKVDTFVDGEWNTVAEVEGNFMRKRTHKFETLTAEKIRVTVLDTWGDKSARIMEIRAGLEE